MYIDNNGEIVDHFDVVLGTYSTDTPVLFRADIDMDSQTWACTIDDIRLTAGEVFSDDFESGDSSGWSITMP
jgi:hypothetical protein